MNTYLLVNKIDNFPCSPKWCSFQSHCNKKFCYRILHIVENSEIYAHHFVKKIPWNQHNCYSLLNKTECCFHEIFCRWEKIFWYSTLFVFSVWNIYLTILSSAFSTFVMFSTLPINFWQMYDLMQLFATPWSWPISDLPMAIANMFMFIFELAFIAFWKLSKSIFCKHSFFFFFSVTQILREINFGDSSSSKTAVLAILEVLKMFNLVNFSLEKNAKIHTNRN